MGIGFSHLDKFGYLGVFSSGIFGNGTVAWEQQRQKMLDDAGLKDGLKVLWFATGSEDFLMQSTKNTIEALKKHGFKPVFKRLQAGIRGSTGGITSMILPRCSSSNATGQKFRWENAFRFL